MKQAYIIDGTRTPIGNFGGVLSNFRTDDIAAFVIRELVKKIPDFDKTKINEVIMGCANQAGEDNRNVARMALLLAGLPVTVTGETVNRLCASGMGAVVNAKRVINTGDADIMIAGGVEGMTRSPYVISKSAKAFGTDSKLYDSSFGWRFINPEMKKLYGTEGMGETAENLAEFYKISRHDQDLFAEWSQKKATVAKNSGRLSMEISPLKYYNKNIETFIEHDEFIKPSTTLEILSTLKPAFRNEGSVTAGNSSGLNDGAAAILIASEKGINENNLKPLARIVSSGTSGVEPRIMGIGPVEASKIALKRAGISLNDIDVIELNEAFAVQALSCTRQLKIDDNDSRLNPNGGAIALGHPLGMSGARIVYSAALQLKLTRKKYALCTLCVGVGQGYALVLESC
ncbi:MAG: acetyl-CoA C-acyltransferase [Bacteroidetes bacterium]|nr:acetyl-CoA C-acyltransferase [Bacteroidota bacterium]